MKYLDELIKGNAGSHILPFLWMKGEDNAAIREELDKIEACGIREVCLESRPYPDYCGPRWWETMDFLVPEAKKRGMRLWILDDRKFPTGYANGGFERHPEYQKWYLAERHMDIMGPCRNSAVLVQNFMEPDGRLLGILACPKPDTETLAVSGEGILDLTANYKDGFVFFDLPRGAYRLFVLFETQKGGGREHYMNLIDSESVRVLIDEVYEKHYEHYAPYFGNTIAGFFSDEPELGNINGYPFDAGLGRRDTRLPWSAELKKLLIGDFGKDFLNNLVALWYDMGGKTARVRFTYMDRLTQLVYRCFSGQVGAWCAKHDVEYIGHIIEDDNAHTKLACSIGHYFREMEGQHMAGIDVVHHQIVPGFTGSVHQWIAGDRDGEFFHFGLAKLGSSAAHLDPKKKNRALCEIFGNYGWAEGIPFMKWLTDHMLVRGINMFTPHAFSMSYPDPDCPPHFYARGNNPEYEPFAWLMRYMQRAASLLSSGRPVIDAAVLYHAESEWAGKPYQLFQKPVRALMENQIDCDVVWADLLTPEQKVEDGKLVINGNRYGCLILPWAACERRTVAEFAVKAAAKGLCIFVSYDPKQCGNVVLPCLDTEGRPLDEEFAQSVIPVSLEELAGAVREKTQTQISCSFGCRESGQSDSDGSQKSGVPGKDLRFCGVENEEGRIYMFFNEHITDKIDTEITFAGCGADTATIYDPWTNSSCAKQISKGENGDLALHLVLEPGESCFVVLEKTGREQSRLPQSKLPWEASIIKEEKLLLTWQVSRADELHYGQFEPVTTLLPSEELPNMNGPKFDPGFTGFYRYDGTFELEKKAGCRYVLKLPAGGDAVRVFVNGTDLGYLPGCPGRVDITDALAEDRHNRLRLEFTTTLVWKRKDGASTHLQLFGTGLLEPPVLCSTEN